MNIRSVTCCVFANKIVRHAYLLRWITAILITAMSSDSLAGYYEFESGTGGIATYEGPGGPIENPATMGPDGWYGASAGHSDAGIGPGGTASASYYGGSTLRYRWVGEGLWDKPPSVVILKVQIHVSAEGQFNSCDTGIGGVSQNHGYETVVDGVVRQLENPFSNGTIELTFTPTASGQIFDGGLPHHGVSASAAIKVTIIPVKMRVIGVVRTDSYNCLLGQRIIADVPSPYVSIANWKANGDYVKNYAWGAFGINSVAGEPWGYYESRERIMHSDPDYLSQNFSLIYTGFEGGKRSPVVHRKSDSSKRPYYL